jgi:hypothetical protein
MNSSTRRLGRQTPHPRSSGKSALARDAFGYANRQLDAFLAAGDPVRSLRRPTPGHAVSEASKAVARATRAQDRDGLELAMINLKNAAQKIWPGAESAPI